MATWLNSIGVTGILLKYRVPRRPDEPKTEPARRPLQDAQRAVSLVRTKAGEWGLRACLKIPERGWVVLDQPQQVLSSRRMGRLTPLCGWPSTQPRSCFRPALNAARIGAVGRSAPPTKP